MGRLWGCSGFRGFGVKVVASVLGLLDVPDSHAAPVKPTSFAIEIEVVMV